MTREPAGSRVSFSPRPALHYDRARSAGSSPAASPATRTPDPAEKPSRRMAFSAGAPDRDSERRRADPERHVLERFFSAERSRSGGGRRRRGHPGAFAPARRTRSGTTYSGVAGDAPGPNAQHDSPTGTSARDAGRGYAGAPDRRARYGRERRWLRGWEWRRCRPGQRSRVRRQRGFGRCGGGFLAPRGTTTGAAPAHSPALRLPAQHAGSEHRR